MNRINKLNDTQVSSKVQAINVLIYCLNLRETTLTSSEIEQISNIPLRDFRKICEDTYYLYIRGEMDGVIIGNRKGYHYETDGDKIWNNLQSKKNNAISQLANIYHLEKKIKHNDNLSFEDFLKC